MQILKQSTAATVYVGPVLDSTGAAVTTAVVGDFRLVKNGTAATLSGATVTHDANGYYTIALTTGNTDTIGRLTIAVGNTAQSMATHRFTVLLASVFDALITNATNATGGMLAATASVTTLAGDIATRTNITAASGITLAATTHTGAVIPTVTSVTNRVTANTDQLAGQTVTAAAGVTFPASVASPTNITAGTITTVSGNVSGNVVGSVGSVIAAVTAGTVTDKTGYSLANLTVQSSTVLATGTHTAQTGDSFARIGSTGSGLTSLAPAATALSTATWTATRAGYLDSVLLAANSNQRTVQVTGLNHVAADIHELQAGVITAGDFATGAIDASALAADAADKIAIAVRTNLATELARIDVTIGSRATQTSVDTLDDYVDTEVAAIKAKTDNLPASPAAVGDIPTATQIADMVLTRSITNTESSASEYTLTTVVLAMLESSITGSTWTIRKTGGTTHATKTVTLDAAADPITGVT